MCMTVTALSNQVVLIPRETLYFGRNVKRFYHHNHYHHHRKICRANSILFGQLFTSAPAADMWRIPRLCVSTQSTGSTAKTVITTEGLPAALTKQQAKELTLKLTKEERDVFLTALMECKSEEDKAGYEGKLAAFRWRSKFGRPGKVPSLGDVDPTGTYCTIPEDWLLRKYAEHVPEPSSKDLIFVGIANAIPFIGFGFLDNFIMIVAGDQIELVLNKRFPISTMAAAALGNTVSDVIGIGSVHYVELFAQKIGFQPPKLTPIQLNMPRTKFAANLGRVFGVTIGCLLGMTPIPIVALFRQGG